MARVYALAAMLLLTTTCSGGGTQSPKQPDADGVVSPEDKKTNTAPPVNSDLSQSLDASLLVTSTNGAVSIEENGKQTALPSIPTTAFFDGTHFLWLSDSAQGVIASKEGNVVCITQEGDLIDELHTENNNLIATVNNTAEIDNRDGSTVEVPRYRYNCVSKKRSSTPSKNFLYGNYERDAETFGDKTFSIDFNSQTGAIEKILTDKGLNLLGADRTYKYTITADGSSLVYISQKSDTQASSVVQARNTETGVPLWKIEFVQNVDSIIHYGDKVLVNLLDKKTQKITSVALVDTITGEIERTITTTAKVIHAS